MDRREERRGSRRFNYAWPIWVMKAEGEVARGQTANISRNGAFFLSESPSSLRTGQVVAVRIGVPSAAGTSARTIAGHARVVRLEAADEGCGIALHFSEAIDALPETEESKE